jgi:membrane protease YdiL (CAAX protease family)
VAALFSVYHAPNVPMMGLGFALSTAMAWLYWATPNLPAAVLCHAVVGTVLSRIGNVPMRGGPFHDRPDLYISRAFFPWLGDWVGPYW